jgi:hypothetical protein
VQPQQCRRRGAEQDVGIKKAARVKTLAAKKKGARDVMDGCTFIIAHLSMRNPTAVYQQKRRNIYTFIIAHLSMRNLNLLRMWGAPVFC